MTQMKKTVIEWMTQIMEMWNKGARIMIVQYIDEEGIKHNAQYNVQYINMSDLDQLLYCLDDDYDHQVTITYVTKIIDTIF